MRRLIWGFADHIYHIDGNLMSWLICIQNHPIIVDSSKHYVKESNNRIQTSGDKSNDKNTNLFANSLDLDQPKKTSSLIWIKIDRHSNGIPERGFRKSNFSAHAKFYSMQRVMAVIWASTRENLSSELYRTTKAQTSLRISANWSALLLFAYQKKSYLDLIWAKFQYSSLSL